jgi:hypothetical protein
LGVVATLAWIYYSHLDRKDRHRLLRHLLVANVKDGDWREAILEMSTKYPDLP